MMLAESWDFPKYVFYDDGRIWSKSKKCFLRAGLNGDGYPTVNLISLNAKDGYRQSYGVHRLVARFFVENPKGFKEVNHKDGIKTNSHYSNLEWCDRSHNLKHCWDQKLRNSEGARKASAKLNEDQVKEIRELKLTQKEIANKYNITQAQVSSIKLKKSWAHV